MKKISILMMALVLLCTMHTGSFADAAKEAEILNAIKIIEGDGTGFNLGGGLKRSEAATFIVKFLGKEQYVLDNVDKYKKSSFSDVKEDAWYAPFVGYCHDESIVAGFTDGSFRPESYVSEKAFLTMLLEAMGYVSDYDFNWNSVLSKAYEVGIVEGIEYAVKTEDNTNYIRGDVVHAIYLSLKKNLNGENRTVVDRLIDEMVTNKLIAQKYDLLKEDEVQTQISSVSLNDINNIKVVFNEDIETLTSEQIIVKINDTKASIESFQMENSKTLNIKVEESLYEGKSYKVIVNNVSDSNGYITESMESKFQGLKQTIIESEDFLIANVQPVSDHILEVIFTQPISDEALQPLMYKYGMSGYSLSEGNYKSVSVTHVNGNEKGVLVRIDDITFEKGKQYELLVRGDLKNKYGEYLNDGEGDSMSFSGVEVEQSKFVVDDVEIVDWKYVKVEFSRGTDSESALTRSNYALFDLEHGSTKKPSKVLYYQNDDSIQTDTVMLKFSSLLENNEYRLEVEDVLDTYGETRVERAEVEFEENDIDDVNPEIDSVEALSRSVVEVTFTEALSEDSVDGKIEISNRVDVEELYWNKDEPQKLLVYLSKSDYLKDDKEYVLTVKSGIEDYLGRSVDKNSAESFDGEDNAREAIQIEQAHSLTDKRIYVTFSDAVRNKDLKDIDNYKFEYRTGTVKKTLYPTEIEVISDSEVILTMESGIGEGDLRLIVDKVYDYSGQFSYSDINEDVE